LVIGGLQQEMRHPLHLHQLGNYHIIPQTYQMELIIKISIYLFAASRTKQINSHGN